MTTELVGPDEIAARLGVAPNTVSMWRKRGNLPEPYATVSRVPMWEWHLVRSWADATGRLGSNRAAPTITRDEIDGARAVVLAEVGTLADEAMGILELFGVSTTIRKPILRSVERDYSGRFRSLDGRANGRGEWDWYWQLAERDRAWLSRSHTGPEPTLCEPDQVAEMFGLDVDEAMAEWVRCVRIIDAGSALRGRITWRRCSHLFAGITTSYDVAQLFGTFADAASYLADLRAAPVEDDERPGELVANLGPSPLDMDFPEWSAELTELEARATAIELPTGEWDILGADDRAVFDRLEELLPGQIGGAANGTLENVYVAVVGAYLRSVA